MGEILKTDIQIDKVQISDKYIILILKNGSIFLHNLENKMNKEIKGISSQVLSVAISPDNKFVAFGCSNNYIYTYDLEKQNLFNFAVFHQGPVSALSFSACGDYIFSGSWDKSVVISDLDGNFINHLLEPSCFVSSIKISKEKSFAVVSSWDNFYHFWNYNNNKCLSINNNDFINYLDVSDNLRFAIIGGVKSIKYLDLKNEIKIMNFNPKNILNYTSSLDKNNFFLYVDASGRLIIYNLDNKKCLFIDFLYKKVEMLKILPNKSLILVQDKSSIFAYDFNLVKYFLVD